MPFDPFKPALEFQTHRFQLLVEFVEQFEQIGPCGQTAQVIFRGQIAQVVLRDCLICIVIQPLFQAPKFCRVNLILTAHFLIVQYMYWFK